MVARFSIAAFALLAVSVAEASEVVSQTAIDAVTVFPDAAVVTRRAEAALRPGDGVLVIKGLPAALEPGSIRVEGEAGFPVEIGSVAVRQVDPQPIDPARRTEAERRIEALRRERDRLDDTIRAAEQQQHLVERFGQASTDGIVKGFGEGKANAAVIKETLAAIGEVLDAALQTARGARLRQAEIDDEIHRITATLDDDPALVRPSVEARIALAAKGEGKAAFRISYRIGNAGWRPAYDARLSTGDASRKPSLALVTRAEVSQATGEDWTGVAMTLSTARTSRETAAADLDAMTVRLWQPPLPRPLAMPAPAARSEGVAKAVPPSSDMLAAAPVPEAVPAVENGADAEVDGTTVLYRVPGRVDVASGEGERNLKVSEQTLEPALSIRAVPKVAAAGYLTASFKPGGEGVLLPGTISLYRDGVFVGTGTLPLVPIGGDAKLGFGEDDRIRVERSAVRQTEGQTGTFSTSKVETRDYRIRVKNLRDRPIAVTVEDQIPVSESTDITVERLPNGTPPTRSNVDDRRGVLAWAFELKPSEEKEIRVGWRVSWPADKQIHWSGPSR